MQIFFFFLMEKFFRSEQRQVSIQGDWCSGCSYRVTLAFYIIILCHGFLQANSPKGPAPASKRQRGPFFHDDFFLLWSLGAYIMFYNFKNLRLFLNLHSWIFCERNLILTLRSMPCSFQSFPSLPVSATRGPTLVLQARFCPCLKEAIFTA